MLYKKIVTKNFILFFFSSILLISCGLQKWPEYSENRNTSSSDFTQIVPTSSSTKSFTNIETPSPKLTTNINTLPTLDINSSTKQIDSFLTQANCSSLCVFNLVPGKSTLKQTKDTFIWMGQKLEQQQYPGKKIFYNTTFSYPEKGISLTFDIVPLDEIIQNMDIGFFLAQDEKVNNLLVLQSFSPYGLISKYGSPNQIQFRFDFPHEEGYPSNTAWYDMVMSYDQIDLIVEYDQGWTTTDDSDLFTICPMTDQFTSASVIIGKNPEYPPSGISIDKDPSVTLNGFVKIMLEKTNSACFSLSKNVFMLSQ